MIQLNIWRARSQQLNNTNTNQNNLSLLFTIYLHVLWGTNVIKLSFSWRLHNFPPQLLALYTTSVFRGLRVDCKQMIKTNSTVVSGSADVMSIKSCTGHETHTRKRKQGIHLMCSWNFLFTFNEREGTTLLVSRVERNWRRSGTAAVEAKKSSWNVGHDLIDWSFFYAFVVAAHKCEVAHANWH